MSGSEGRISEVGKIAEHEDAAHEKRNWVRLTFDCNDHCVFCLDAHTHNGEMRDRGEVKAQILDGRRKGATRLILSGGEPTIHPNFVDFVRLGRLAGYSKIQTVTNGRLFKYAPFITRAIDEGLSEITFSIHGPNSKVHDALVGTKGAFEEELQGLKNALADGRVIVNIDVVINRANVRHLPEMLRMYTEMGVKEFDLLQVVPFGRAFTDGRDTLFYDLGEARPYLQEALAYSKRPDVHIWMNRFPPQHLEGYEHLIQDPYKLEDEVRGRKEEFARLLDGGEWLDCREPQRCKYCYLQRLCDTLEGVLDTVDSIDETDGAAFSVVRVDTEWESKQPQVFGGDPASLRKKRPAGVAPDPAPEPSEAAPEKPEKGKRRTLPVIPAGPMRAAPPKSLGDVEQHAEVLWVKAPDLTRARQALERFPHVRRVELELDDVAGVAADLDGRKVERVVVRHAEQAAELLSRDEGFEVALDLIRANEAWLLSLQSAPSRLVLRQPSYERLTEAAEHDLDLRPFFEKLVKDIPVEGVPACISGRPPRARPRTLDTAMMSVDGRVEIFRFARRYLREHYRTKSLRCGECAHDAQCDGLHINFVRAHGYAVMEPVARSAAAAE
ncbi:MAG: radical SAM protein [Deltaproteobacteria bacterium]|nr:radical SAM protein [Deltaproteobacteria bacterium]